jgi:3-hydroxybutyryl-CoA dehydrogenase
MRRPRTRRWRACRPAPTSTAIAGATLVVEAATENVDLKHRIFRDLDRQGRPRRDPRDQHQLDLHHRHRRTSPSAPSQVIGMHFMNPVPVMQLVEVIRGLATSDATVTQRTIELSKALGKTPVEVNDFPGFVANRILLPMINEAVYA